VNRQPKKSNQDSATANFQSATVYTIKGKKGSHKKIYLLFRKFIRMVMLIGFEII
jgi:hypothetical protein